MNPKLLTTYTVKISNMKKYILLLLICLLVNVAFAQTEFRYEHYTIENGLSSNYTTKITQDKYGFLWIGTIDGLNCFNGYEFKTYFKKDKDLNSLSENFINDLIIDRQGSIWVATNIGLNKYIRSSDSFQRFFCNTSKSKNATENLIINSIQEAPDGNLWLGTEKGIRIINPVTNEIVNLEIKNKSLVTFIAAGIGGIYFDTNGAIWFGSSVGLGLRIADSKTWQLLDYFSENNESKTSDMSVRGFFKDSHQTLWLLTNHGLFSYQHVNNLLKRYVSSIRPNDTIDYEATSIIEDQNNVLWVGLAAQPPYYTSIAVVDTLSTAFKIYPYMDNDARGLSWSYTTFIFQDQGGIFWVGTSRGFDKMDPLCQQFKLFQSVPNSKYTQYNNVYSIFVDSSTALLATDGKGLLKFDLTTKKYKPAIDTSKNITTIFSLLPYDDNNILLGCEKGIWQYNFITNNATPFIKSPTTSSNLFPTASCIIKGSDADYWFAFMGAGLTHYNDKTKVRKDYQHNPNDAKSIGSNLTNVVFRDSRGTIWAGSANSVNTIDNGVYGNGLDRFNPHDETFTHFVHDDNNPNSISGHNIICIAEDKNGILWIGTRSNGLNKFDTKTGKFFHYTKSDGLPSNYITAIQVDELNRIWISTFTNGMACLDQSNEKIKVIDVVYGLQNIRFNRQSTFKTKDGELYFGGVSGFNSFFPSKIKFNTEPPLVRIIGIKINKEIFKSDSAVVDIKSLHLNYQQSELQFDFVAMSYSQSYKNQYAYQLVGYDKSWINAGTIRSAKYTNLNSGKYIFNVKACNNDGVWNETGTSITIIISPPWYKTWWAYLLYSLALLAILFAFIAYRSKALRNENAILEEKVNLRTVQLETSINELKSTQDQLVQQEKLASLGALTAGIAHEIKNPLNFVNNFAEVAAELVDEFLETADENERNEIASDLKINLQKIGEHGKRADSIVKNMLAHSRTGSNEKHLTNINALCEEYLNLAYHGKRASNQNFNCEMIKKLDDGLPLVNCVGQDISRVVLNLINNAFDACQERAEKAIALNVNYKALVTVTTKHLNNSVAVSVRDNGNGISPTVMQKILEPFFTTKPAGKGTGLGLSLSNDIIKAHGGELKIESIENEFSEFTFLLPI